MMVLAHQQREKCGVRGTINGPTTLVVASLTMESSENYLSNLKQVPHVESRYIDCNTLTTHIIYPRQAHVPSQGPSDCMSYQVIRCGKKN